MTLPNERTLSLLYTRNFLRALLDPKQTPRVPKSVRQLAAHCLKHYPWYGHIRELGEKVPESFGPMPFDKEYDL